MEKNKKPIHFLVFKILGFVGIIVAIIGFSLVVKGFGDFETNNFMLGGFLSTFGLFVGVACLITGFKPEITKLSTKSIKYIQEENKEDLKDIVDNTLDITHDAIVKTSSAIKNAGQETKFCKHCGAQIDSDSRFCSKCGKEQ